MRSERTPILPEPPTRSATACGLAAGLATLLLGCQQRPDLMPRAEARPASYGSRPAVSGRLDLGADSDTQELMAKWGAAFSRVHPHSELASPSGSQPAVQAFLDGKLPMVVLGRKLKPQEIDVFRRRTGHLPQRVVVAQEPLAILVQAGNPLASLSLARLGAMFSAKPRPGLIEATGTWWDLGLAGDWADRRLTILAPREESARCGAFKEQVQLEGEIRESVRRYSDPQAMQDLLLAEPGGIAMGPMQGLSPRIKVVPLEIAGSPAPVFPTAVSIRAGQYPLVRFLYLYTSANPGTQLPPAQAEFVRFCLSKEGQDLLPALGLVPVPADVAKAGLSKMAPL